MQPGFNLTFFFLNHHSACLLFFLPSVMGRSSHYSIGSRVGRREPFMNAASLLEGVFPGEEGKAEHCLTQLHILRERCLLSGPLVHWFSVAGERGCERGHTHHCHTDTPSYIYTHTFTHIHTHFMFIMHLHNVQDVCMRNKSTIYTLS